tara:strand:+ start:8948 stop:9601 length:654 start_codon:yes stop_codon:yes gene_type:complete
MFKRRIGITQRVIKHKSYNEFMDCLDLNWANLLISLEILPIPLPLTKAAIVPKTWKSLKLDGIIFSGGNTLAEYSDHNDIPENISPERDLFEMALIEEALSTKTAILGVCRGLQLINIFFNGKLKRISGHAGTRHSLIKEESSYKFDLPSEVNSFHDFVVPKKLLGKGLTPLAYDNDGNIEAFYNQENKVIGIMWHPEREKIFFKSDCALIKNHFGI